LSASAAYIDARLEEDAPSVGGERDDTIPGVPQWAVGLRGTQRYRLPSSIEGFVTADYRYRSAYWTDFPALRDRIEPTHLLDLRTGIVRDSWTLEFFVENALDERVVLAASNNLVGHWEAIRRPRTIGIRLLSGH
jgi:outer membrane receptor protein involved in Fe transport